MKTEIEKVEVQAITKFEYNVVMLEEFVEDAKGLDRTDIEAVTAMYKKFVKVRTGIKAQEKAMVEGFNKQKQSIFDDRNIFLEITVPVEEDLKILLDEEKQRELIETRKATLPIKRKQLDLLELEVAPTDEFLLEMDGEAWGTYYNGLMEEREARIEKAKQDIIDEANQREREADIKEKARLDGIKEAEDAQEKKEKAEKLNKEREVQEKAQKEHDEKLQKIADAKKLASDEKYQKFFSDNDYCEKTDRAVTKDGVTRLYRLVAEFTHEEM